MEPKYLCHRILPLVIALMVGTNGYAQTTNGLLKQLEQIKSTYGEMDERYMDALNEAVGIVGNEGQMDIALKIRQQHTELCRKKYGEYSIQYAEGLVKLGNCVNLNTTEEDIIPLTKTIPFYEHAISIFEEIGKTTDYGYIMALDNIKWYYTNNRLFRQALIYSDKWLESKEQICQQTTDTLCYVELFVEYVNRAAWYNYLNDNHNATKNALYAYTLYKKNSPSNVDINIALMYSLLSGGYRDKNNIDSCIIYDNEFVSFAKSTFGEMSQEYMDRVSILANDYFRLKQYDKAIELQRICSNIVRKIKHSRVDENLDGVYNEYLAFLATYLSEYQLQNDTKELQEEEYNINKELLNIINAGGVVPILSYDYLSERIRTYQRNKHIDDNNTDNKATADYILFCINDGKFLITTEDTILKNKRLEDIQDDGTVDSSVYYMKLGNYYILAENNYEKAKDAYIKSYDFFKSENQTDTYNYYSIVNNLGVCWLNLGNLYSSIIIFETNATNIRRAIGEYNIFYAASLLNMSNYNYHISNNPSSLYLAEEAAKIIEAIGQNDNINYGETLVDIGILNAKNGMDISSIQNLQRSIDIIIKEDGELSPRLVRPYGQLIVQYAIRGEKTCIDTIRRRVDKIWEKYKLGENELGATYIKMLGITYMVYNNPESWQYFGAYLRTIDSLSLRLNDNYFKTELLWTLSGFLQKEMPSNNRNIVYLYALYQIQYWQNVFYLNHKERESILTSFEYNLYKDLVFSLNKYDTTNVVLYNFILLNKGLLLATSVDYAKTIYKSSDSVLIRRYERLQAELKKNNSSTIFSKETANIQKEEREIIAAANKLGASDYVSCNYDSIISVIKDNEVALEYVSYTDYNRLKEGIIEKKYAAIVVRKDLDRPIFIQLCSSEEIEPLTNGNPNLIYGGGEVSQSILQLLWKPLEKYVHKGDNVFFSPDGCLYKLALENIQVAEGLTLGAKYNMHRCSSTRQIRDRQTEGKYRNAVLYGGLSYDVDDETMLNNSRSYAPSMTRGCTPAFGGDDANVRRGWNYLPGTKQEIDEVSSILRKKKIVCDTYSGAEGNEESFKAKSGSNISILHIATHGFYIQEAKAENVKLLAKTPKWMQNTSMIDKALRRSGLMLAGGNKAWKAGYGIEGIEDGVLTAQEIANMNLASVDLLVLSACETGLGDVANEGVFGLQWAFKSAGVGTIIMSLWDVDDNATALMMKSFYKELTSGKSKRDAFKIAQKEVKKTYNDPLQWAAFIMLDG